GRVVRGVEIFVHGLGVHTERASHPHGGQFSRVHETVDRHLGHAHQRSDLGDGEELGSSARLRAAFVLVGARHCHNPSLHASCRRLPPLRYGPARAATDPTLNRVPNPTGVAKYLLRHAALSAPHAPCPAPVLSAPYQHVGDLSHAEHGDGAPPASPATATTSHPSASSSSRVDAAANSADFDAAASTASATAERYPPASRRLIAAAVVPPGELTAARRPAGPSPPAASMAPAPYAVPTASSVATCRGRPCSTAASIIASARRKK